MFGLYAYLLK